LYTRQVNLLQDQPAGGRPTPAPGILFYRKYGIRNFPFDFMDCAPAYYTSYDTKVLHLIEIALAVNWVRFPVRIRQSAVKIKSENVLACFTHWFSRTG